MRIVIRVPAMNERGPQYMDQALAAIQQANPRRLPIKLEFARQGETVTLACSFPHELRTAVEQQLFAHYPDCKIEHLQDEAADTQVRDYRYWAADLTLCPDVFPIKRYPQWTSSLRRGPPSPRGHYSSQAHLRQ